MNKVGKVNSLVYRISLIATLGGFLFGYDTAVISGAISSLDHFFVKPMMLSEIQSNALLGFIVSSALFGCIIGSLLSAFVSNKFGRKKGLLLSAFLFLVSAIGSSFPEIGFKALGSTGELVIVQFIVYRLIGGIGIGLASVMSPMYISEIAPSKIRGKLVSWNQLALVSGILLVYFVNFIISLQGDVTWNILWGWRWMFVSSAIPAALFFGTLWFVPESPRWLLLKGRETEAVSILSRITNKSEMQHELEEIRLLKSSQSTVSRSLLSFGFLVLFIGMALSVFQQLVGIQVVMYYTPEIFKNLGTSSESAMFQTIMVGTVNFVFTIIAIKLVDKSGRKPLLIVGSFLMFLSMTVLGICFYVGYQGILSIVCVMGFVGSFAFSWGPVTWVLLSEIFPNAIRGKAMAIAVAVQWISNYLVSLAFPLIDKSTYLVNHFHHAFSFWFFGAMAFLSFLFVWRFIPETKEKSLEEIEKLWKK